MSVPMLNMFEMIEQRAAIRPIFESFLVRWDKQIFKTGDLLPSPEEINSLIEESIKIHPDLTKVQYAATQSFFDTFVTTYHMSGREMAMIIAKRILVD